MTDAEQIDLLTRRIRYLAPRASISAKVVHCDYDPAGNTTEYEADPEAVTLFGDDALYFQVGCGPTPTKYTLNIDKAVPVVPPSPLREAIERAIATLEVIRKDTCTIGSDYGIPHVAQLAENEIARLKAVLK